MTKRLKLASHFILFLLENNPDLNKILISQASDSHLAVVAEILQNIFRFPLSKKKKLLVIRDLKLIKKYLENKSKRKEILVKNQKKILSILVMLKPYLRILFKRI